MRSYKEILSFLIIREQLLLAWKIMFFIVCGSLVFGSLTLMRINIQTVDFLGIVIAHGAEPSGAGREAYLIVKLDNGESVRVRVAGWFDFRPGQRALVREITTNFLGLKKYEFKDYLDQPRGG